MFFLCKNSCSDVAKFVFANGFVKKQYGNVVVAIMAEKADIVILPQTTKHASNALIIRKLRAMTEFKW